MITRTEEFLLRNSAVSMAALSALVRSRNPEEAKQLDKMAEQTLDYLKKSIEQERRENKS